MDRRRSRVDVVMRSLAFVAAIACVVPLAAVIFYVVINGIAGLNLTCSPSRRGRSASAAGAASAILGIAPDGRAWRRSSRCPSASLAARLRQRVRSHEHLAGHPLRRGRPRRRAVDPDRHLRLHVPRAAVQAVQRVRRRDRARGDHDPGDHADDRGDPEARPRLAPRGVAGARDPDVADGPLDRRCGRG